METVAPTPICPGWALAYAGPQGLATPMLKTPAPRQPPSDLGPRTLTLQPAMQASGLQRLLSGPTGGQRAPGPCGTERQTETETARQLCPCLHPAVLASRQITNKQ